MQTIETYDLAELREKHPNAFKKVLDKWAQGVASDSPPWSDETMDSLKAVVHACGATLAEWSIGASGQNSLRVRGVSEEAEEGGAEWFRREVLKPKGYTQANGHAHFPGECALTGYCADDDFLESVYKDLKGGESLTRALENLADVAGKIMEDDLEQHQGEESMLANWGDRQYTAEGIAVS